MLRRFVSLTARILALTLLVHGTAEAEEVILAGPPIWESAPLVVLAETQPIAGTTFVFRPWSSPEELRKLISGDAAVLAVMPAPTAALLDANGIRLRLLSATITVGSLSIVGRDKPIARLSDLKGASLALPFKGYLPDLLMRRIETPEPEHWQPRYTGSLVAGMQLLLAGQVDTALLAEPMASLALELDTTLVRMADVCLMWKTATAQPGCPPAGVLAMNPALTRRSDIRQAYQDAFSQVAASPGSAATLLGRFFPEVAQAHQGYSRIVAQSLPMPDHAPDLAAFYAELLRVEPAAIGNALPKPGFYGQ